MYKRLKEKNQSSITTLLKEKDGTNGLVWLMKTTILDLNKRVTQLENQLKMRLEK